MMVKKDAPKIDVVKTVAGKYLNGIIGLKRVPKGVSTYVYRITTEKETYYLRFLPEDASFAAEALAHKLSRQQGVSVPRVLEFEHKNEESGMSTMLTETIPGNAIEDDRPEENLREILNESGRQIALMHRIPVDGFGWIDRTSYDSLKGVHKTFSEYFEEWCSSMFAALERFEFTDEERTRIPDLVAKAGMILKVDKAVLVHGDFDASHIFHHDGKYSGIIDLGEIRGNNRLSDLMDFATFDRSPGRNDYTYMVEGYRDITPLTDDDLYAVELFVLSRTVFAAGSITDRPRLADFFYRLAKDQIKRITEEYG